MEGVESEGTCIITTGVYRVYFVMRVTARLSKSRVLLTGSHVTIISSLVYLDNTSPVLVSNT
jgi:hypothetical protein